MIQKVFEAFESVELLKRDVIVVELVKTECRVFGVAKHYNILPFMSHNFLWGQLNWQLGLQKPGRMSHVIGNLVPWSRKW